MGRPLAQEIGANARKIGGPSHQYTCGVNYANVTQ